MPAAGRAALVALVGPAPAYEVVVEAPSPEPAMPESPVIPADQPGLHPSAFGLRRVGAPGVVGGLAVASGLRVHLPAARPMLPMKPWLLRRLAYPPGRRLLEAVVDGMSASPERQLPPVPRLRF